MKMLNFFSLAIIIHFAVTCRPMVTTTLEAGLFDETVGHTPDPQLVDVRTPGEYNSGYLPGAVNIDIKAASFDSLVLQLDRTRPVFVYCRSGKRSMEAASVLEKYNFKVVYNLDGGINAWKAKGKPVVAP